MPPRYAYWTILVDGQPTAFRAAMQDDLMPTFRRLKEKHPSAVLMWFQNGTLWSSRLEAQEAMRARGERGKAGDVRQGGGFRDRKRSSASPRPAASRDSERYDRRPPKPRDQPSPKLEWKPKGSASERPKLEWTPKGKVGADRPARQDDRRSAKPSRPHGHKPDARGRNWRPGGDHQDPRQKYKDAKKAKWQRFKKTIRARWDAKQPKRRRDEDS
jgi:hypothetical protein